MTSTDLTSAFPSSLAADVRAVVTIMPPARFAHAEPFSVKVQGEPVHIPYRIYNAEAEADRVLALTTTQQAVLHCVYTRHHDGYVRHRHVERILGATDPWVVPFVVRLVGEYVLEIVQSIQRALAGLDVPGSPQRVAYGDFLARNPLFFAQTESRVVSYWSEYYRREHPSFPAYPGRLVLDGFRNAIAASRITDSRGMTGARDWDRRTARPADAPERPRIPDRRAPPGREPDRSRRTAPPARRRCGPPDRPA